MAFVIVVMFITIQLKVDESLPPGFPNQINEAFTKVNMFLMQQYVQVRRRFIFIVHFEVFKFIDFL